MERAEVVANVVGDLNTTEQAVDAAIAHATTLVQSMIGARAQLNLSPVAAAQSQALAMEAIAALSAARSKMVECHNELAKDHRRLGFGVFAGPWADKGVEGNERPTGRLRAV